MKVLMSHGIALYYQGSILVYESIDLYNVRCNIEMGKMYINARSVCNVDSYHDNYLR